MKFLTFLAIASLLVAALPSFATDLKTIYQCAKNGGNCCTYYGSGTLDDDSRAFTFPMYVTIPQFSYKVIDFLFLLTADGLFKIDSKKYDKKGHYEVRVGENRAVMVSPGVHSPRWNPWYSSVSIGSYRYAKPKRIKSGLDPIHTEDPNSVRAVLEYIRKHGEGRLEQIAPTDGRKPFFLRESYSDLITRLVQSKEGLEPSSHTRTKENAAYKFGFSFFFSDQYLQYCSCLMNDKFLSGLYEFVKKMHPDDAATVGIDHLRMEMEMRGLEIPGEEQAYTLSRIQQLDPLERLELLMVTDIYATGKMGLERLEEAIETGGEFKNQRGVVLQKEHLETAKETLANMFHGTIQELGISKGTNSVQRSRFFEASMNLFDSSRNKVPSVSNLDHYPYVVMRFNVEWYLRAESDEKRQAAIVHRLLADPPLEFENPQSTPASDFLKMGPPVPLTIKRKRLLKQGKRYRDSVLRYLEIPDELKNPTSEDSAKKPSSR